MKKLILFAFILLSNSAFSQEKLNLEVCYNLINKNYPLAKQTNLLAKQNEIDIEIIKTGKMPKIDFDIQATYQSDVTKMPITVPGYDIEAPNLDQYKANISLNQLIYAGGKVNATANVKIAELKTQQKQIEVSLYQLKNQVNQLYFSILNLQEKNKLLSAKKNQLLVQLKEVKSGIEFGVVLPSSDKVLEVELIKIEQQFLEIELNKISLIETLSKLIGTEIKTNITLENPIVSTNFSSEINRPELDLFQLKKEQIEISESLISKQNAPTIMGFANGGLGNPGLDMLENAFKTYYWVGVKLNWNIFNGSKTKKERKSLLINKEIIDNETETFNLNTNIELNQQQSEINKINAFIESDYSIVKLRENILKTTESQLKNGVITSSAYITELTNLYEAENNLNTHKIQLLLAKANYNITQGN
jgi:outer membrane protein TolC